MRMTRALPWAAAIVALSLTAPRAFALETFKHVETKTFEVGANPTLNIEAISGNASYTGTDATTASVEIVIEVRAKNTAEADEIRSHLELLVEGESGFLDARVDESRKFYDWLRDEYSRSHHVTVDFHVTGPRGAEGLVSSISGNADVESVTGPLEITSVSGDASAVGVAKSVRANSTSGNVDVRQAGGMVIAGSVSGDVLVSGCGGDLDIESTSGNVSARDVAGDLTAETTSGDIDGRGIAGGVDASSVSGSIWVENSAGTVRASTTSGDIEVLTRSTDDVELESLSGSVDLALEPEAFGDVYLSASSGGIESNLPIKVRRQSEGRLEGTLGTGTASLRVTTSSGDIVLNEL
jgi:DUF4097 and DUF4098 domain-containing protein YvlB